MAHYIIAIIYFFIGLKIPEIASPNFSHSSKLQIVKFNIKILLFGALSIFKFKTIYFN